MEKRSFDPLGRDWVDVLNPTRTQVSRSSAEIAWEEKKSQTTNKKKHDPRKQWKNGHWV
jgi:hypothetical protein